jgi:tRNA U38,U39,U40 pseudouridine synthase TruA
MNIDLIKQAVRMLIGLHDFRNFCKKEKKDKNQEI